MHDGSVNSNDIMQDPANLFLPCSQFRLKLIPSNKHWVARCPKNELLKGCGQTSWQACWSLRLKWFITLFHNSNASSPHVVRTILRQLCWILSSWPFEFIVILYSMQLQFDIPYTHIVSPLLSSSVSTRIILKTGWSHSVVMVSTTKQHSMTSGAEPSEN